MFNIPGTDTLLTLTLQIGVKTLPGLEGPEGMK